jgi:outer membrane protein TolC
LEQRPEIREAELKRRSAELDQRLSTSGYIPDVSFTVQYLSALGPSVLPRNGLGAGLMLSWDVFDWGRRKYEAAAKQLTAEQARYGAGEVRAGILLDVDRSWRKLEEARSFMLASELEMETARERMRLAAARYEQKAALLKDVLETQASFAKFSHDHRQAMLGFWTAEADFERALGDR